MNSGTLLVVIYLLMVILISTGWWTPLMRHLHLRRPMFIGWLTLFVILSKTKITLMSKITVNTGFVFVLTVTIFSWKKIAFWRRPFLFSGITLLGSVCYLVRELAIIDPALLPLPAMWLQVITVLLLASLMARGIWERIALFSGGLSLGYLLFVLRHLKQFPVWMFGEPAFFDLFWVSLLGTVLVDGIERWMREAGHKFQLEESRESWLVATKRKSRYD